MLTPDEKARLMGTVISYRGGPDGLIAVVEQIVDERVQAVEDAWKDAR